MKLKKNSVLGLALITVTSCSSMGEFQNHFAGLVPTKEEIEKQEAEATKRNKARNLPKDERWAAIQKEPKIKSNEPIHVLILPPSTQRLGNWEHKSAVYKEMLTQFSSHPQFVAIPEKEVSQWLKTHDENGTRRNGKEGPMHYIPSHDVIVNIDLAMSAKGYADKTETDKSIILRAGLTNHLAFYGYMNCSYFKDCHQKFEAFGPIGSLTNYKQGVTEFTKVLHSMINEKVRSNVPARTSYFSNVTRRMPASNSPEKKIDLKDFFKKK